MKGWKEGSARRAIVMISNGISPAANLDMPDPLAEDAIATAQRQRITLYAIYHPSSDYLSTDFRKLIWGQDQLAHVALETGGEAYFLTSGPLPSMAPYLADISTHLANQYLLEFLARPNETTGVLSDFQVSAKDKRIELMVPYKAWIPNAAGNGVKSRTSVQ